MRPEPTTGELCDFVEAHRAQFGVAPIYRALSSAGLVIGPNSYYIRRRRGLRKGALWEATISEVLAGYYDATAPGALDERGRRRPESLYGSVKMWAI